MSSIYLYLNAVLYFVFALWCAVLPEKTSQTLGFASLTSGGRSEYLAVYGGLQLGLAIIFLFLARHPAFTRLGLLLSIALYAPIVAFRMLGLARNWPVGTATLATAALELVLLIGAVSIYLQQRPAAAGAG